MLARGGVVTRPTQAFVGEGGPEAIIPLEKLGLGGGRLDQDRGGNTATTQRSERDNIDMEPLINRVDDLIAEIRRLDNSTTVELDGRQIAEANREGRDRFLDERDVTQ